MTPPAPPAPAGGKAARWAASHKPYVIAGSIAAVLGLVAFRRKTGTSLTSGLTGSAGAGTVAGATTVPYGGYTSDPYSAAQDAYNSLEPQLQALQSQVSAVSSGAATAAVGGAAPVPAKTAPNPSSLYDKIASPQAGAFLASAGDPIYADVNGQYVQVVKNGQRLADWNKIPSGSSLFIKK